MILRPCDDCGGKGRTKVLGTTGDEVHVIECPACIDMPWLRSYMFNRWLRNNFEEVGGVGWIASHNPCKPDPSTVMHWCQKHKSAAEGSKRNRCQWSMLRLVYPDSSKCDIVWIKRPTPLEEVARG